MPASTATPTPRPYSPPGALPRVITRGNANRPQIALTFDLGSVRGTSGELLSLLQRLGLKATFFVTGQWAEGNPDLLRQMVAQGHELGNHSYSHPDLTKVGLAEAESQLTRTEEIVRRIAGVSTKPFFRPPFGAYDASVVSLAERLGYQTIYWSLDSTDWRPEATVASITQRVVALTGNGYIVIFHAAEPKTLAALPAIVAQLQGKGFALGPLSLVLGGG